MSELILALDNDRSYSGDELSLPFSGTKGSDIGPSPYAVMQRRFTPSAAVSTLTKTQRVLANPTLEAQAYDALARAKVWTSQVATHLDPNFRGKLFGHLDRLHDISEWENGDLPMLEASFANFLRMILRIKPTKFPSLVLSHEGNIFAIWGTATDRVTLEFLTNDDVNWVLSQTDRNNANIRAAGVAPASKVLCLLNPYEPEHWFYDSQQNPRR